MINAILRRIKLDLPNTPDKKIISAIEKALNAHDREVLALRLPWTQLEVAKKFGVSKERIRAIEARLFEKVFKELHT